MSGGIYGITLDDSWYNTLEGNTVSGSTYNDMILTNASYNTIAENKLSNSGAGLQLTNSVGNTLYLNDFLDGIFSADSGNTWYSPRTIVYAYNGKSYSSRLGNRYTDYAGQDKNGDGIGTQRYNKNGIRDNYPLTDTHEKYTLK
jgi:parallel beta-helix repeat protein